MRTPDTTLTSGLEQAAASRRAFRAEHEPEGDDWVDVAEAATFLGLGEVRVRELIRAGTLPAVQAPTGYTWRIRSEDLGTLAYERSQDRGLRRLRRKLTGERT